MKEKTLKKSISGLQQILGELKTMNAHEIIEARSYIHKAMAKLQEHNIKKAKNREVQQTEYEKWWENVRAGVVQNSVVPSSRDSQVRALKEINAMIDAQKKQLADLERNTDSGPKTLLND